VERHGLARAGCRVDLRGVTEFFFDGSRGRRLDELSKPRSGVGKTPRRDFNVQGVENLPDFFNGFVFHGKASV